MRDGFINRAKNKLERLSQNVIDGMSIKLGYLVAPETDPIKFLNSLEDVPKIAFVKQDILSDLYCCPPFSSAETIVFSTLLRNGPFTLFTKLNADFWMVKPEEDEECQIWKERCFTKEGIQFLEYEEILKIRRTLPSDNINNLTIEPEAMSVHCQEVDWSKYDIVICVDIPVPTLMTQKFANTVWCYCLMEPYMASHAKSSEKPIAGYHLFLNQRSRTFRLLPKNKFHEIDFPYCLQYYGCYHDLLHLPMESPRSGVFIEKHTERILTKSQLETLAEYGPIYKQSGSTFEMLNNLMKSKYFIRVGGNVGLRWANSMIEAIAAGCLFLGNPNEFVNKSLFTPKTCVYSFNDLIKSVNYYEQNAEEYDAQRRYQQKLVNWLCFCRPLQELIDKTNIIRSKNRKP